MAKQQIKQSSPSSPSSPQIQAQSGHSERSELPHEALLQALYFFQDAFERASLNFFLVRDTASRAVENTPLSGSKLTLGIRKNEWAGHTAVFDEFAKHERVKTQYHEDKNYVLFMFKDVPVYLYLYEDNPTLEALDTVFYQYETFRIPNPLKTFEEKYD